MYNCIRSMKKILIIFNHPAPYKVRLFNELSKFFDLHVIFERNSASDRNKLFYSEKNYNFTLHKIKGIPVGKENFISRGIIKHLKENKYDLIIMNGYSQFAEMTTLKYLKKNQIPYVLYINGGIIKTTENKLKKAIKSKYISGASWYFSPDAESNKYLIYYGAQSEKILNYPYSTIYENEIKTIKINKKELREEIGIPFDKMFISSGQLIRRKNYLSLVEEWKNYPQNWGLYIMGDGNQKDKIVDYIRINHMKNVVLTGFMPRETTLEYISAADAFLFPSNEDIYGHVINESLSQGVPVISTKHVNSAIKLIEKGQNGFLLSSLIGKDLHDSIEACLNNDMFDYCIKIAKQNTLELMTKAHVDMINEVTKQ